MNRDSEDTGRAPKKVGVYDEKGRAGLSASTSIGIIAALIALIILIVIL